MIASTLTVDPLEDVAKEFGNTPGFFQLLRPTTATWPRASFTAPRPLALPELSSLSTPLHWAGDAHLRLGYFPQLPAIVWPTTFRIQYLERSLINHRRKICRTAARKWAEIFANPALSWNDLSWLRSLTKLPLLLKGIGHPDDAGRAIDGGVDGIYCSNHGGRQANGGVAALDLLPSVVHACGNTPVLFDSGVPSGEHIIKALALGATAVAIGRPYAYGLASPALTGSRSAAHAACSPKQIF